jgi:hypothetical protein
MGNDMRHIKIGLTLTALAALVACGGGGGGGNTALNSAIPLSGSISQGAPIVGAKITLTDAKGTIVDGGTSGSDGSYTIPDISNLTAPIIISAQAIVGGTPVTYRSLLAQKNAQNTANVTPLTDAVLIQSTGKSAAILEGAASTELANIDLSNLNTITGKFVTSISNVLDQITPGTSSTFNPFTTAFVANGETAADKVNDLVRVTTTITPNGVQTDITDKSNSVGTVTISDGVNATALPSLPQNLLTVNPKYLSDLIEKTNFIFSTAENLDSTLIENGMDDNYLNNGLDKATDLNQLRTTYRQYLLGAKFSNPKLVSCDIKNICHVQISVKNTNLDTVLDEYYKYDPVAKKFSSYGNHFAYKAEFGSSLTKSIDQNGTEVLNSQIQFYIGNDFEPSKYKSATATLQSGTNAPDMTYNFALKAAACPPTSNFYDGMPLDDGTNYCGTWKTFSPGNESEIKAINEKIKQGNYTVKFQAWTTSDRTGTPDIAILPITDPILTTDKIGPNGYPQVKIVQGSGNSLPYLSVDNADDFIVTGTLCITSSTGCSKTDPQPHTTQSQPNNIKLPSKYEAKATDGWQIGEKAKGYFIHVRDKAGRDIMVSRYNF